MSITTVTRFHASEGQEDALLALQTEGRRRMLTADGCESFEILREQGDARSSALVQRWTSERHTTPRSASGSLQAGSLEKVLGVLDEGAVQTFYDPSP